MAETTNNNKVKGKGAILGVVVSDRADKTRVVEVRNRKTHAKYKKTFTVTRRYKAHDPENKSKMGDKVTIVPARPFSKTKKFIIV